MTLFPSPPSQKCLLASAIPAYALIAELYLRVQNVQICSDPASSFPLAHGGGFDLNLKDFVLIISTLYLISFRVANELSEIFFSPSPSQSMIKYLDSEPPLR